MNATVRLRGGDALNPVHTAFILEPLIDVRPIDLEDNLLIAAQVRSTGIQIFDFPSMGFRVMRLHSIERGGKESSFLTSCPCPDFDDRIA